MEKIKLPTWSIYLGVILFLITIGDLFGLINFHDVLGKGEAYDFVFVASLGAWIIMMIKNKRIYNPISREEWKWLIPLLVLVTYCIIEGIILVVERRQGSIQTIFVLRELGYLLLILPMLSFAYDTKAILRLIMVYDAVGCLIYLVEMVLGPLTRFHIDGKMEMGLYRFYSDNPMFAYFLCPLIIYSLANSIVFFSKKIDGMLLILYFGTMVLRFSKMQLGGLLVAMCIAFLTCRGTQFQKILKQLGILALLLGIVTIILKIFFPSLFVFFYNGVIGLLNFTDLSTVRGQADIPNTMAFRTRTMILRWNFLKQQGRILLGMGPLHNDSAVYLDIYDEANQGIIASDIAYGTIMIRYGIIGIIVFIGSIVTFAITMLKQKAFAAKSLGSYCIGILIAAICGHVYLCFQAMLKLAFLIGIVFNILREGQKESEHSNERHLIEKELKHGNSL
ncbi:hypothetical protein [[Ruminococcus] torques]|uniref:hypothetical protein n=1 Tax=[Ruminococcus] torques TaxID=33039 RepID=UPI0030795251